MKPTVTYPDPERALVDIITSEQVEHWPTATIGVTLPEHWTPSSPPHIQVAWDGTPDQDHPVAIYSTIRITTWAATTTTAKELALRVQGVLAAYPGADHVTAIVPLIGVMPARDPDNGAPIASFTVRVTVRSTPLI